MMRLMILNGPNLNMLGIREPHIYGTTTINAIEASCQYFAKFAGAQVSFHQSNHEGQLLDWIAAAKDTFDGMLLNAGAYTHTSLALFDALKAVTVPCVEVHISNPEAREAYRKSSVIAPACIAKVSGFGTESYVLALEGLVRRLAKKPKAKPKAAKRVSR